MNSGWSIWYGVRKILVNQWKILTGALLFGAVLGSLYGSNQPTTFTARSEIVTGTYSLPSNIGTVSVVDKAGPLALELPAETQARIISSPAIVRVAAEALDMTPEQEAVLAAGVKASPTTDNSFGITAPGMSAQQAADNANAIATAYLAYRTDVGRGELSRLAQQADGQAASSTKAARAMDAAIAGALSDSTYASTLLTRQQELERSASAASVTANSLNAMSLSFTGGGSVLQPATAYTAAKSVGLVVYTTIGALGGLALGIIAVAIRRQISDRIVDRQDIIRITGLSTVYAGPNGQDSQDHCALILRSVANSLSSSQPRNKLVAVRALTSHTQTAGLVHMLTAGATTQDRHVAVLMLDNDAAYTSSDDNPVSVDLPSLAVLGGEDHGAFELAANVKAAKIMSSTPDIKKVDIILMVSGARENENSRIGALPQTFNGPIILVVREWKDKAQVLHNTVEEFASAGLSIGAIVLLPREPRRRGRTAKAVEAKHAKSLVDEKSETVQANHPSNTAKSVSATPRLSDATKAQSTAVDVSERLLT